MFEGGEVNEEFPFQVDKVQKVLKGVRGAQCSVNSYVPILEEGNDSLVVPLDMTNGEIREALLYFA